MKRKTEVYCAVSPGLVVSVLFSVGAIGGLTGVTFLCLRAAQPLQPRKPRDPTPPPPWMQPGHAARLQPRWTTKEAERQRRSEAKAWDDTARKQAQLAETYAREQAQAEQHAKVVEQANFLIMDRIAFLRVAKSKAVTRWGELDSDAWSKATRDFMTAVLLPRLGKETTLTWVEVEALIESALAPSDTQSLATGSMTPLGFEQRCADLLQLAGWTVRTTKASGDQGADVVASKDGRRVVLQCKLYSRPVGNGAVQEAAAARDYYKADVACVVTNAGFTSAARDLAVATRVRLLAPEQLETL